MRSLRAGSSLLIVMAAACGRVDTSGTVDGPGDAPANCDADGDGFFHPHPSCDDERGAAAPDCDDNRDDVHPGAALVCGDGAVNDCTDFGDTAAALGVEEVGVIGEQAIFRTDPGGFINNLAIAAEGGTPTRVVLVVSESARNVRVVHAEMGNAASAISIPVSFPANYSFANNNVDMIRLGMDSYQIATQARGPSNSFVPAMARFGVAGTINIPLQTIALGLSCPANVDIGGQPYVLRGLDDAGDMFYELKQDTDPPVLWGVAARISGDVECRPLAPVGGTNEFGSQLVATGNLAVGRTDTGLWIWDWPINYDDLHAYQPMGTVNGVHAALARNVQAGEPVLLAYSSQSNMMVEALQCTGLAACTRLAATPVPVTDTRDMVFTPLAGGAMLVQVRGDFVGTEDMVAQLVDANGVLLGGGLTIPLGEITLEYRSVDAFTVPPGIGREYYDIMVAYAVADGVAMQHEMRVRQVRACQAK